MFSLRWTAHFPFYLILLASTLLSSGVLAQKEGDEWTPRLSAESLRNVESRQEGRGVIYGLLGVRQSSCPSGYGLCKSTSSCCPLRGDCCSDGDCCAPGRWCYASGCCRTSQAGCARKGCIPEDTNCCSDGSYCYSGYNCVKWDSGTRGCCQEGILCLDPSYTYPTVSRSTTRTTSTAPITTRTTSTTTTHDISTSRTTTASPIPTVASSDGIVTMNLNDPTIHWEGSWDLEISPCDHILQAKTANGTGSPEDNYSMSISFQTSGSIDMSIEASSDAVYAINVGGVEKTFTGTPNDSSSTSTSNCEFTFSSEYTLAFDETSWSMIMSIIGPPTSNKRGLDERQSDDGWWFRINQFNIKPTGSPSITTSTKPAGPNGPTTVPSNRASKVLPISWVTVLLVSVAAIHM